MSVAPLEASPTKFSLVLQEITQHADDVGIFRAFQIIEHKFQSNYENDSGMGVGTPLDQRENDYNQALNKLSAFAEQEEVPGTTRTALADWLLEEFKNEDRFELINIIDALIHATPTKCLRGGENARINIFERDKIPIQLVCELAYHYLTQDPSSYDERKIQFTIELAEAFDPNTLLEFLTNKLNSMTKEGIQLARDRLASMHTLIGERIVIHDSILEVMRNWDRHLGDLSEEEQKMTIALVVRFFFRNRIFTQSNYPSDPPEQVNGIEVDFFSAVNRTRNILGTHCQTVPAQVNHRTKTASERWTRNVRHYYRKCAIAQYLYINGHLDAIANCLGVVNGQALANIIRDQLRLTRTKLQNLYALLPKPHSRSAFCKSAGCSLLSFVLAGLCLFLAISNPREGLPLLVIASVIGLVCAWGSASYLRGIINENAARPMWTLPNEEVFMQLILTVQNLGETETSEVSHATVRYERWHPGRDQARFIGQSQSSPELALRGSKATQPPSSLPLPPVASVPVLFWEKCDSSERDTTQRTEDACLDLLKVYTG